MNLENVKREDMIIGGLALLLLVDLLFLPWFDISVSALGVSLSVTSTATGAPDGWLGILAAITTIALLVDLVVSEMSPQTQLPSIGGSRPMTRFLLAALIALFLFLKFLFHINHFSDLGLGFWGALILIGGLVYFAMQGRGVQASIRARRAGPTAGPTGTAGPGPGAPGAPPPSRVTEPPPSRVTEPPPPRVTEPPAAPASVEPPASSGPPVP